MKYNGVLRITNRTDAKANSKYDKFAESRRALKEKQAEADYFNQLADVAEKDKK